MPELARQRLAMALDATLLAETAGIVPDAWQSDALRDRSQHLLLNCSRQSGKSTVAALRAVDELLRDGVALVLIASPTLRQSQELARKVRDVLAALGPFAPPIAQESSLSLELVTGARVVCLPGSETSARSWSAVTLFIVDEAARCSDELYYALRPVLATSGGRIVLLSTPHGRRGFFFREWTEGQRWQRVQITADQCPRIPREWLEQERAALPPHVFAAEYMCQFTETTVNVFGAEHVYAALRSDVRPLWEVRHGRDT